MDRSPAGSALGRRMEPAELAELLGDWAGGPGPIYRKLAVALYRGVRDGSLEPGTRLPSERLLAAGLGVSRATVVSAYDELRGMGAVDSRRGSGTVINRLPAAVRPTVDGRVAGGRAESLFQRLVDGPGEMISLAYAVGGPIPEFAEEAANAVREDLPALTSDVGYHPRGLPALRTALASHFGRSGLPTGPDETLVTTGASQALALIARMYLRRGSVVVVESPGWPGCFDVFQAAGARLVGVPMDSAGIRPDLLAQTLRSHAPDLVYVMPAHNPTGTLMSSGRRDQVARIAASHGVPVVEDHAYDDSGSLPPIAVHGVGEVLTVGSLAKSVWAGLRIGWIRGDPALVGRLARLKALADLGSPVLDQAIAARLVPRLPALAVARRPRMEAQLALLSELLLARCPAWRWDPPACGSALWIELPGVDARVFAQVALRHGVEVVPGAAASLGDGSSSYESYIRVPFTFPEPVQRELVDRLANAWSAVDPQS